MTRYDVRDKVVVITGAGKGIGLATAKLLAGRGAHVAVLDVDAASAAAAAESLGGTAIAHAVDVRDRAGTKAAVDAAAAHFGRVDVVIANAGIVPPAATLRTMDGADFDRVVGVNLTGVFNTVQPALEQIIANQGYVSIIASAAAFAPGAGGAPYMISKSAVEQLGRALRIELAPYGAAAGVVYFGVVETDMTHDTLDADELGRELGAMLPWPLSRRISADTAARVIADAVRDRAAQAIAPAGWDAYSMVRGAINVVVDRHLSRDKKVHSLVRRLEERNRRT